MTTPGQLAAALRAHARGDTCLDAAATLLIAQDWLYRNDFTARFITLHPGTGGSQPLAVTDWPAVAGALGTSLPCSGGERRMLAITASIGGGIPVDLRDALTGLDDRNLDLVITAVRRAGGSGPDEVLAQLVGTLDEFIRSGHGVDRLLADFFARRGTPQPGVKAYELMDHLCFTADRLRRAVSEDGPEDNPPQP